jgi:hypothetical protein
LTEALHEGCLSIIAREILRNTVRYITLTAASEEILAYILLIFQRVSHALETHLI